MFINRLFFGVFLLSSAEGIGGASLQSLDEVQTEKKVGPLRGGRFGNGKKTLIPPQAGNSGPESVEYIRTLSFGGESVGTGDDSAGAANDAEVEHMVIKCKKEEEKLDCKKRISGTIPKESKNQFRLGNYLELIHAFAAEVKGDKSILDALEEDDVLADPPRETMHIKESIQIHRNLQSQATPYGIALVKAMDVWEKYGNKGENVRICVMDTGVDRDHPDLDESRLFGSDSNDLVQPWYRDIDGHGTHVTGTIAASDNGQGVVGVAPGAEIFTARVFSTNGQFYSSNIITALQACKDGGANVISMSLGGPYSVTFERQAYDDLHNKFGIVTVAASGNTGSEVYLYPASYDYVISVASVNWNRDRSSFSTKNNRVDVAAPGSSIVSTWDNGSYASVSGTSMSCPHVSGVVALMLNANPSATPSQIFTALQTTSENPNTSGRDDDLGYGIVNALAAVEEIAGYNTDNSNNQNVGSNTNNSNNSSSNSGNTSSNNAASGCVELVITLKTDRYGGDTSHWLQEGSTYLFFENGFDSFSEYQERACLDPTVCSTYNIRDSFGDGISGEGVEIKYGGEVVYQGGDFGIGGIKYVGACEER